MTNQITLSYGTVSADLTDLGVSISHMYNNPIIQIPTPIGATVVGSTTVGATTIGWNVVAINIGFVTNRYALKFTITDGFGSMNFGGSGTTVYEKLVYMTNNQSTTNPKILMINDYKLYVHVESLNISFAGVSKDLALNCSLNLIAVQDIPMV